MMSCDGDGNTTERGKKKASPEPTFAEPFAEQLSTGQACARATQVGGPYPKSKTEATAEGDPMIVAALAA
jgi:hypothetical protein